MNGCEQKDRISRERKRFRERARQALFVLLTVLLLLAFSACGGSASSEAAGGPAERPPPGSTPHVLMLMLGLLDSLMVVQLI